MEESDGMRILLLADIHSNWPALASIDEDFDACLVLGDIVDYATDPIPCIEWVQQHATLAIRGNHDHAVAQRIVPQGGAGFRQLAAATRPLHWSQLTPDHMSYLQSLPVMRHVTLGDWDFFLVHGTPRDPLDEYLGNDPTGWTARLQDASADFVCVGHTHIPFHLELDDKQVVNPGSVGQPRDGNPQAAYAIIEDGRVELRRCEYDIEATLEHMRRCGVSGKDLDLATHILRTGSGSG